MFAKNWIQCFPEKNWSNQRENADSSRAGLARSCVQRQTCGPAGKAANPPTAAAACCTRCSIRLHRASLADSRSCCREPDAPGLKEPCGMATAWPRSVADVWRFHRGEPCGLERGGDGVAPLSQSQTGGACRMLREAAGGAVWRPQSQAESLQSEAEAMWPPSVAHRSKRTLTARAR